MERTRWSGLCGRFFCPLSRQALHLFGCQRAPKAAGVQPTVDERGSSVEAQMRLTPPKGIVLEHGVQLDRLLLEATGRSVVEQPTDGVCAMRPHPSGSWPMPTGP